MVSGPLVYSWGVGYCRSSNALDSLMHTIQHLKLIGRIYEIPSFRVQAVEVVGLLSTLSAVRWTEQEGRYHLIASSMDGRLQTQGT